MTELLVEHPPELARGQVAHRAVRLDGLELVEAPVELLEGVHGEPVHGLLVKMVLD